MKKGEVPIRTTKSVTITSVFYVKGDDLTPKAYTFRIIYKKRKTNYIYVLKKHNYLWRNSHENL